MTEINNTFPVSNVYYFTVAYLRAITVPESFQSSFQGTKISNISYYFIPKEVEFIQPASKETARLSSLVTGFCWGALRERFPSKTCGHV